VQTQTCKTCLVTKDISCFSIHTRGAGRLRKDCKSCVSNREREAYKLNPERKKQRGKSEYKRDREKRLASNKLWRQANPDRCRDSQLKVKYGLSIETYYAKLEEQGGVCAICGSTNPDGKYLSVDHCHLSGKIRSLLCNTCNRAIGLLKDDPSLMEKAAEYVRRYRE